MEEGTPAETIVRVADEENADLIVMFTDGRDGLGDLLIGSITERGSRLVSSAWQTATQERMWTASRPRVSSSISTRRSSASRDITDADGPAALRRRGEERKERGPFPPEPEPL